LPRRFLVKIFNFGLMLINFHILVLLGCTSLGANGRLCFEVVALRLDRAICNDVWLSHWKVVHCCNLYKHCLDHHPLIISQDLSTAHNYMLFRFLKVWTSHPDCSRVMKEISSKPVLGNLMACLQLKLTCPP
jgi:hypothetical protein